MAPGLYVVATPIGNLRDITLRALDTLRRAALVLCEDTRVTGKLFAHFGLESPLLAYHDHNAERVRPKALSVLEEGRAVALVSDAGTPLVSDPGFKLVAEAVAMGIPIYSVPGPSSVTAALSIAGLPTDRFFYLGFLPPRTTARRRSISDVARIPATLVILEAPQRLAETLRDLANVLGPRRAAVARELTKRYEEVRRAPLDALAHTYETAGPPKGEIVIVIAPPDSVETIVDDEALDHALLDALATAPLSAAVAEIAAALDLPRKRVYARALALRSLAEQQQ